MGWRRLSLAAGLVATAVAAGCTDGTTPDCSDGQCRVVDPLDGGGDGAATADGPAVGSSDAGGADGAAATSEVDAGADAPALGSRPDDASTDAASHPADAGHSD
jgi:hypothetical protein